MHYYEVKHRRPDRTDLHTEWLAFSTQEDAQAHLRELRRLYFIAHMRPISQHKYERAINSI